MEEERDKKIEEIGQGDIEYDESGFDEIDTQFNRDGELFSGGSGYPFREINISEEVEFRLPKKVIDSVEFPGGIRLIYKTGGHVDHYWNGKTVY